MVSARMPQRSLAELFAYEAKWKGRSKRVVKYGSNGTSLIGATPAERFWRMVTKLGDVECWPWAGAIDTVGYGKFGIARLAVRAHRVSWYLHHGDIPKGMFVLHRCDNRKCVNPAHLFLGTNKDNMRDMRLKDRGCSPLSNADVLAIIERYMTGESKQSELAAEYGISETTIYNILTARCHGAITGELRAKYGLSGPRRKRMRRHRGAVCMHHAQSNGYA